MSQSNRTNRLFIFLAPLGVACVAALLLLKSLSAPPTTQTSLTSTPGPAQEVVAYVGEQGITFADWSVAFHLDALMNHLSGQPAPLADKTLERLINDALVLTAAAEEGVVVSQSEVEARIASLLAQWGLTEDQLAIEMRAVGLNRQIGVEAVARLLTVERYVAEVVWAGIPADEQADALAARLQTRRAEAGGKVDPRGLQPALPPSLSFPTAAPTPSPSLASTAMLLAASSLATPSPQSSPTPTAASALTSPLPLPSPSLAMGQPAPDFALSDANGQTIQLSDYRDQRKVVIVFFRTTG